MSVEQIKALSRLGAPRRTVGWTDERRRSPKGLGDWSGLVLNRVTSGSTAGIQDYDYDVLAQVYICNDLAWNCMNLVSSTAALARLRLRKRAKDGTFNYLDDHPLQKLLDFPNSSMTQFDLIQSYIVHQLLYGTVSMLLLRSQMAELCPICVDEGAEDCIHKLWYYNEGPVEQIMPVHPSNIQQFYSNIDGLTKKYFFYVPGGSDQKKYIIHPNNILTDPLYNPDVSWYGVSPTWLVKRWLDLDVAMTDQITQFFKNGAIPSLLVSLKPGSNFTYEDEPQTILEMLKQNWMTQFSSKGIAEKSPAFVYGDINIEKVQENVNEMVAKNLYYQIEGRVCAAYGVPQNMHEMGIKYGSNTGGSGAQVEKDFYNNTISKYLARIKSKLNQLVVATYGDPTIEVEWDLAAMGIASFLIEQQEKNVKEKWQLGLITRDETRALLGHEPTKNEFGDDFYRITVMNDGVSNQSNGNMDNRLKLAGSVVNEDSPNRNKNPNPDAKVNRQD